ncbi:hypothetical protein DUNSADRAFT_2157 [Dunaliella salina]|uniref:Secreted protein n=1 Tax=Dunaliella salina TaxID=3046 RepID=A0ABQ7H8D5_DUNSA|nr:hypothetical protein DUNSADRAFT_2157 [Dunaliella salina]|eukprot:KAF5843120.1 hypothetical protein DUNSADRAFT_2157 [Dunaliella salina]
MAPACRRAVAGSCVRAVARAGAWLLSNFKRVLACCIKKPWTPLPTAPSAAHMDTRLQCTTRHKHHASSAACKLIFVPHPCGTKRHKTFFGLPEPDPNSATSRQRHTKLLHARQPFPSNMGAQRKQDALSRVSHR